MGTAGDIFVEWKRARTELLEQEKGKFSISLKLREYCWWLTEVYGPTDYGENIGFCEELSSIGQIIDASWYIGGDFNVVPFSFDRSGNSRTNCFSWEFIFWMSEQGLKTFP